MGTPISNSMRITLIVALFLCISLLSYSVAPFEFDTSCWINWSRHNAANGVGEAYTGIWNNYMPFYQYVLYLFGIFQDKPENIAKYIYCLKSVTLLFDFYALWLVYKWAETKEDFLIVLFYNILNVAFVYDTLVWGQMDGIGAALIFGAMYFAWKRNLLLSGILLVLSVNMKLQIGVFVPVWAMLVVSVLLEIRKWRPVLLLIAGMLVTQLLLVLPFILSKEGITPLLGAVTGAFTANPNISICANNGWCWFFPDYRTASDLMIGPLGITYKTTGLLLFFTASFFALLPMLRSLWRQMWQGNTVSGSMDRTLVWLTAALVAICFFFFNTEMHERYSHPAFIFLTAYAFYSRNFIPYIVFSIAYFLNLEHVMHWLKLPSYGTLIFDESFGAALYAFLIVYLYFLLYRDAYRSNKQIAPVQKQ